MDNENQTKPNRRMNPASLANLVPNSKRTHEQLSQMGRKGGKISGQVRREQKEEATTIVIETVEGDIFRVKGRTPEAAAAAAAELETALYLEWKKAHGIN